VADEAERDIVVENAFVRGVFSSRGAELKSWRLKRYFDDEGQPLELVPMNAPEGALRPFALSVDDAALTARLQRALYRPSAAGLSSRRTPTANWRSSTRTATACRRARCSGSRPSSRT
jgi:YidC/Oxa1 family membrane protein insertase